MKKITHIFLTRFNAFVWWGLAALAWGISRFAQAWLDGYYARSKFPVPFFEGQTTFNAVELKGYYAHMLEQGTLDIYVQTQVVDFVFMAASFVFLLVLAGAALRSIPQSMRGSWLFTFAKAMVWIMPLAPLFDAMENLTSFVMLANPEGFSDWLVYPYSSFAATKFGLFTVGYLWAMVSLLVATGWGLGHGLKQFGAASRRVWKTDMRSGSLKG